MTINVTLINKIICDLQFYFNYDIRFGEELGIDLGATKITKIQPLKTAIIIRF
jgi:hypothetical protein